MENFSVAQFPRRPIILALSTYARLLMLEHQRENFIMDIYGNKIRQVFTQNYKDPNAVPVLICAFNEEGDLPQLLYGLSQSTRPLVPVVVDNNSIDATAEIASKLGATVIYEPNQGLANALRTGFEYLQKNYQNRPILLTDADSFPISTWADTNLSFAKRNISENGGELFGPLFFYGNGLIGIAHTLAISRSDKRRYNNGQVKAHGANAMIVPDNKGRILTELARIDTQYVRGTDELVKATVASQNGKIDRIWGTGSLVFTRGDRINSLKTLLDIYILKRKKYSDLYQDWFKNKTGTSYQ